MLRLAEHAVIVLVKKGPVMLRRTIGGGPDTVFTECENIFAKKLKRWK